MDDHECMYVFRMLCLQIGVDFALKVLNWDANSVVRLQLWDIAGNRTLLFL